MAAEEDWAVLRFSLDESDETVAVEVLFASRSDFATSLVETLPPSSTETPVRERTTLVLDSNVGSPVPIERRKDLLTGLSDAMARALTGFDVDSEVMFLVRVGAGGPTVLFSTDEDLSRGLIAQSTAALNDLGRENEEIDFVFVRAAPGTEAVSLLHTRYVR